MKCPGFRPSTAIVLALLFLNTCSDGARYESPTEPKADGASVAIQERPGQCEIRCISPPEGCVFRGQILIGPCQAVTCGHLVCGPGRPDCPPIDCAAPPPGCHYEGMILFPCNRQTCGTLVCDGSSSL